MENFTNKLIEIVNSKGYQYFAMTLSSVGVILLVACLTLLLMGKPMDILLLIILFVFAISDTIYMGVQARNKLKDINNPTVNIVINNVNPNEVDIADFIEKIEKTLNDM